MNIYMYLYICNIYTYIGYIYSISNFLWTQSHIFWAGFGMGFYAVRNGRSIPSPTSHQLPPDAERERQCSVVWQAIPSQLAGWRNRPSMPNLWMQEGHPISLGCNLGKLSLELRISLTASLQTSWFPQTSWPQHPKVLNNVNNRKKNQKTFQTHL